MFTPRDESGASAVEYGLIVTAIAGLVVIAVFALGSITQSMFSTTCTNIHAQVTAPSTQC
jgi:pilus assembly protein Flp/PilA